ncbi:MAG: hypothetical protein K5769_04605 [Pseudobutyrivibrio sp.]|nr:hypothetical protein [Pseudobutyrivibrio sp.]
MFSISNDIYQAIQGTNIVIEEVTEASALRLLSDIKKKYIDSSQKSVWLWEQLAEYEYISDNNAWSYIKDFISNNECIMFFNIGDEDKMFRISNGNDLNYILAETFGYEFYITNEDTSFLLCFNHHDILYAAGEAKKWIKTLV